MSPGPAGRLESVTSRPATTVVDVRSPLSPAGTELLCARVRRLLLAEPRSGVVCSVTGRPDLTLVDALARIALLADRAGACLTVRADGTDLSRLLDLTGLAAVVRLEGCGQAEAREQRSVEEVVDVRDPTA